MKKMLIGSLVGGLILFVWQFLSFAMLNLHSSQMQYSNAQDEILQILEGVGLEEGEYFIPQAPPGSSSEEQQAEMEKRAGKPWAQIVYHKSMDTSMSMNMLRAFLIDIVAILLLIWILLKFAHLDLKTVVYASVAVGMIGYLTISYLDAVWFETNSWPNLIDAIVPWAIIGGWLGWYLPEKA